MVTLAKKDNAEDTLKTSLVSINKKSGNVRIKCLLCKHKKRLKVTSDKEVQKKGKKVDSTVILKCKIISLDGETLKIKVLDTKDGFSDQHKYTHHRKLNKNIMDVKVTDEKMLCDLKKITSKHTKK